MRRHLLGFCVLLAFVLVGCATTDESILTTLDEHTAVTLVTLPVALEFTHRTSGAPSDPAIDVSLGPVTMDHQGAYSNFLWVAVVNPNQSTSPYLRLRGSKGCEILRGPEGVLANLPISAPPYPLPATWAQQYYFTMTRKDLDSLEGQAPFSLEISYDQEHWQLLDTWTDSSTSFDSYLAAIGR